MSEAFYRDGESHWSILKYILLGMRLHLHPLDIGYQTIVIDRNPGLAVNSFRF